MNRLSIYNFGPVKKAELDLKSINLLIGEQSVGKSTIAKLIAIFTDDSSLSMLASQGIRAWNSRLSFLDLGIYNEGDYRVKYELEEKDLSLVFQITKNRVLTNMSVAGDKIRDKNQILNKLNARIKWIKRRDVLHSMIEELEGARNENPSYRLFALQSLMESSLYVPAERVAFSIHDNLKSAFALLGDTTTYTYKRFMVSLDKAKERLKKYESPLLNIVYSDEDNGQFFEDIKCKKKYHLFNASSGIQSTIPLLLVLEDIKNRDYSSIVIEEPETNLFPKTQVEILKLILKKARVDGRIVTVTTHSPYLLSALNNYLYAGFVASNISNIEALDSILPAELRLEPGECAVYSIGESINKNGEYCSSLIDPNLGMINMNTLDQISFDVTEEFERIETCYIRNSK